MTNRSMRSMLFVPGNDFARMAKADRFGADALIFDLEDAVALDRKAAARETVCRVIDTLAASPPLLFVRVNSWGTGMVLDDLNAVVRAGLDGIVLSKTASRDEVVALGMLLGELERTRHIPLGSIDVLPLTETASGKLAIEEICRLPRVRAINAGGGATEGGDSYRTLGLEWTEEGLGELYAFSRAVLAGRAAGVTNILGGMSLDVDDLELLRRTATKARQRGATGAMVIHPSHIAVVHEVFTPTARQIEEARTTLVSMAEAIANGAGVVRHHGRMLDYAHVRTSLELLQRAESAGIEVGAYPSIDLTTIDSS